MESNTETDRVKVCCAATTVETPRERRNQTVERVHVVTYAGVQVAPCASLQLCKCPGCVRRDRTLECWRLAVRGEDWRLCLDVILERDCATSKLLMVFLPWERSRTTFWCATTRLSSVGQVALPCHYLMPHRQRKVHHTMLVHEFLKRSPTVSR